MIPDTFLKSLEGCEGFDLNDFVQAHNQEAVVSVRMNQLKVDHYLNCRPESASVSEGILNPNNIKAKVCWSSAGLYLKKRPSYTIDPLFHAGLYYVQEASSMFIEHALSVVLSNRENLAALDLCASPGGKTTLLSSLPNFRVVLANEIIQSRLGPLFENVVKWGAPHVFISNNDPKDFDKLGEFFDLVLVDAPCSGSGLFRKDQQAKEIWNKELVEFCSVRQKRILSDAVKALADGGYLLYSTCSYSCEENEMNLDYLIEQHGLQSVFIETPKEWGVIQSKSPKHGAYGYRFYPDKIEGEGFFCALLKKDYSNGIPSSVTKKVIQSSFNCNVEKWIEQPKELFFFQQHEELFAVKTNNEKDLRLFQDTLRLKKSGIRLGSMVRGELNPDHELAMGLLMSKNIRTHDLEFEQALKFLKKENIEIPFKEKGWVLMTYQGVPLGWMKAMEGRSNNYYPKNWRITMRN